MSAFDSELFVRLSIRRNCPLSSLKEEERLSVCQAFLEGRTADAMQDAEVFLSGPGKWLSATADELVLASEGIEPPAEKFSYEVLLELVEKAREERIRLRRQSALDMERANKAKKLDVSEDEKWMREALKLASYAAEQGEIPIGAIVVRDGEVIGSGGNSVIGLNDPTAHAEIRAIREASRRIGNYRLEICTLYVTLEPCPMCSGAVLNSRINRVVYGASATHVSQTCGSAGLLEPRSHRDRLYVTRGVLESECRSLLDSFFESRRTQTEK